MADTSAINELIASKKVIVLLGAGGVGKTTSSIALALLAAKAGRRVGLLSIDPAKRLATALGIRLGSELRPIAFKGYEDIEGTLEAAMLDQKAVFDEMVERFSSNPKTRKQIFEHSLYQAVSNRFGGALEYMALAKLQRMIDSERYDLIVLDTPPDAHALDFLARPNILAGFMEHKVIQWLIKPFYIAQKLGLQKLVSIGERLAGGIAEVTGVKAMQILAEFIMLMQDVIAGFHAMGEKLTKMLRSTSTGFVVVSTPRSASIRSAISMIDQLTYQEFPLDFLIINRCLPDKVAKCVENQEFDRKFYGDFTPALVALQRSQNIGQELETLLLSRASKMYGTRVGWLRLEEQDFDLHSLEGMFKLADALN